jgi:hypothetical protein
MSPPSSIVVLRCAKLGKRSNLTDSESAAVRLELRFPCVNARVVLRIAGSDARYKAEVIDISGSGLRLRLSAAVAAGSQVRLDLGSSSVTGEIRYCFRSEEGFFIAGASIGEPDEGGGSGARRSAGLQALSAGLPVDSAVDVKPLTSADEALLCGRSREIHKVVDNCRCERLTVITAQSGLGITSLLDAGVAPALKRDGFIVATFHDWLGPAFIRRFRRAIVQAVRAQACLPVFIEGEPLDQMLHFIRAQPNRPIVKFPESEPLSGILRYIRAQTAVPVAVLLDQFEDHVCYNKNTHSSDLFEGELAHEIGAHRLQFVIGLQDRAIPAFERMRQHVPNLYGSHIRLGGLAPEDAREAVLREARVRGVEVEPTALDALVSAPVTRCEGGVHPFFLKVAAARLPVVKSDVIKAAGGVDRVILESLDPVIRELSAAQRKLLFRWLTILISPEGERLPVAEKVLTADGQEQLAPALLTAAVSANVLRTLGSKDGVRYEISHDCLVPILRDCRKRSEATVTARLRAFFRSA